MAKKSKAKKRKTLSSNKSSARSNIKGIVYRSDHIKKKNKRKGKKK